MKAATSKALIDVDDLRIGMFVHLDMSWMSHPFPLGSFKIAAAEQIATYALHAIHPPSFAPGVHA